MLSLIPASKSFDSIKQKALNSVCSVCNIRGFSVLQVDMLAMKLKVTIISVLTTHLAGSHGCHGNTHGSKQRHFES